jgi:hypothetical protein
MRDAQGLGQVGQAQAFGPDFHQLLLGRFQNSSPRFVGAAPGPRLGTPRR